MIYIPEFAIDDNILTVMHTEKRTILFSFYLSNRANPLAISFQDEFNELRRRRMHHSLGPQFRN